MEQKTKRPIYKKLTRDMLQEMGIYSIDYDYENNEWWIDRYWHKTRSTKKEHIRLAVSNAHVKRKYTEGKTYPIVSFSYNHKGYCFPLARVIYAWVYGEIGEGMVVDHIDNDPFNNMPFNLQALTQEENLRKRYSDNPNNNHNQWDAQQKINGSYNI